ncbi:MAG: hypothetical protein AAGA48_23505 [Myxococcota bacterium]
MIAVLLSTSSFAADLPLSIEGCEILSTYEEVRFTFHVETEGELKVSREWLISPKTNQVTRTVSGESITFTRGAPTNEAQTRADAQFINDSFWLYPQCHVGWATDIEVTEHGTTAMPFGEGAALKTTVRYPAVGGGYTPGDAYDLFHNAQGEIVAWHYRRRNADEPSLTVAFNTPERLGPLKVATNHPTEDGAFRVYFTDLSATP